MTSDGFRELMERLAHAWSTQDTELGWREYVRKGPASFDEFTATEGKTWQWHIGNYP